MTKCSAILGEDTNTKLMNLSKAVMEASNGGPVHVMRRSRTRSAVCKKRPARTDQNYLSLGMAEAARGWGARRRMQRRTGW
jgi:hypothetical protein